MTDTFLGDLSLRSHIICILFLHEQLKTSVLFLFSCTVGCEDP